MTILNLTQHEATEQQVEAGVVEPANKKAVQALLTFDEIPASEDIHERARALAIIARDSGCSTAMIGGAPYLMGALEKHLHWRFVQAVYAFSVRESVEQVAEDGSVTKTNVFRHVGFVCV